jgi:antiphage defense system Thoeris ThsB-like protein
MFPNKPASVIDLFHQLGLQAEVPKAGASSFLDCFGNPRGPEASNNNVSLCALMPDVGAYQSNRVRQPLVPDSKMPPPPRYVSSLGSIPHLAALMPDVGAYQSNRVQPLVPDSRMPPPPGYVPSPASIPHLAVAPPTRIYKLFISHAWAYSADYTRLVDLLKNPNIGISWSDSSIPQTNPIMPNPMLKHSNRRLVKELDQRIQASDCILVLSGMYCAHSEWIQSEIEAAQEYAKPIIGVLPWGQERVPEEIRSAATELVGWRTDSVVSAIRRHAR